MSVADNQLIIANASVHGDVTSEDEISAEPERLTAPINDITLVVDNTRFSIKKSLLTAHPNTMLGAMFSTGFPIAQQNEQGEYEITTDISHTVFEALLGYYQCGVINCPASVLVKEMKQGCDYFLIPFENVRTYDLQAFLHIISNEGARKQFNTFLIDLILPNTMTAVKMGARECQVIVLLQDEQIDWNAEHAPKTDKEFVQIVHSDAMHRFFKHVENRDVAKQLMIDRGLRKVRCGFEWCPTRRQKRPGVFTSVSRGDVQRSFIHISWEQEESRNRHVGFQLITSSMPQVNVYAPRRFDFDAAGDPINNANINGPVGDRIRIPFAANEDGFSAAAVVVDEAAGGIVLLSDLQRAANAALDEQGYQ